MRRLILGIAVSLIAAAATCAVARAGQSGAATKPTTKPARPIHPVLNYTAPPLPAADPAVWVEPITLAKIIDPLSDAEYAKRVAALKLPEKFDVAEAAKRPRLTAKVMAVGPGGPAEKAGIKVGESVVAMNGERFLYQWQITDLKMPGKATTIVILGNDGKRRRCTLPPGMMELTVMSKWDAVASWTQSPQRDARFDTFVRVAAITYRIDAPLARSAIARAQKAGYDGHAGGVIPAALAGMASVVMGDFDQALALGGFAIKGLNEDERPFVAEMIRTAAYGDFKLQYALDLSAAYPLSYNLQRDRILHTYLDGWKEVTDRVHTNPQQDLKNFDFHDASGEIVSLFSKEEDDHNSSANTPRELAETGRTELRVPSGRYRVFALGPGGPNVDASLDVSFAAADNVKTNFTREFIFGIIDAENPENSPMINFLYFDNGDIRAEFGGMGYLVTPKAPANGHHHIRLIVVGQRCEMILDGVRTYYGPFLVAEHHRKLGLRIQAVGINGIIHHINWRIAEARKEP